MITNSPFENPHTEKALVVLTTLNSSPHGLSLVEARSRLDQCGPNTLPQARPPGIFQLFLHQFASPLIYVLLVAALVSLLIREWSDAGFIGAVLLVLALSVPAVMEVHKLVCAGRLKKMTYTVKPADLTTLDKYSLTIILRHRLNGQLYSMILISQVPEFIAPSPQGEGWGEGI